MNAQFAFLNSYSPKLAQALRRASSAQCREVEAFALSRVPKDLLAMPEVRAALQVFNDEREDGTIAEHLGALEHRFMRMSDEAAEEGDAGLAEEYFQMQTLCGGLISVVENRQLTPNQVDRCLYQLINVMLGDHRRDLEEFVEKWGA